MCIDCAVTFTHCKVYYAARERQHRTDNPEKGNIVRWDFGHGQSVSFDRIPIVSRSHYKRA